MFAIHVSPEYANWFIIFTWSKLSFLQTGRQVKSAQIFSFSQKHTRNKKSKQIFLAKDVLLTS